MKRFENNSSKDEYCKKIKTRKTHRFNMLRNLSTSIKITSYIALFIKLKLYN